MSHFRSLLFIWAFMLLRNLETAQTSRYKGVKCKSFDLTWITSQECKIKVTSRTESSLILRLTLLKPVDAPYYVIKLAKIQKMLSIFFQINVTASYRYGTIFREIYKAVNVEWCSMMDGSGTNPIIKSIIESIKDSIPQMMHDCPYVVVSFKVFSLINNQLTNFYFKGSYNLTVNSNSEKFFSIIPTGLYKYVIAFAGAKSKTFSVEILLDIKSEIKTSF